MVPGSWHVALPGERVASVGALPFMDPEVRCRFHLAAGNEGHGRRMAAAPTRSMLMPLTSGPGNGRSFAPPSRLGDAAQARSSEPLPGPLLGAVAPANSRAAGSRTSRGSGQVMDVRVLEGPPPPHSHCPRPSTPGSAPQGCGQDQGAGGLL